MSLLLIKANYFLMNQRHTFRGVLIIVLSIIVGGVIGFFIAKGGQVNQQASLYGVTSASSNLATLSSGTSNNPPDISSNVFSFTYGNGCYYVWVDSQENTVHYKYVDGVCPFLKPAPTSGSNHK